MVHTPQFNGKQEGCWFAHGQSTRATQTLTCAAPATVSGRAFTGSASITATERFEHALGKAMEVVPPARIPANTVEVRLAQLFDAHALAGKPGRDLSRVVFS